MEKIVNITESENFAYRTREKLNPKLIITSEIRIFAGLFHKFEIHFVEIKTLKDTRRGATSSRRLCLVDIHW